MRQDMNRRIRADHNTDAGLGTRTLSAMRANRYGEDGARRRKMPAYVFEPARKNGARQIREDSLDALERF